MADSLFDVYQNIESAKEFWDSLESKYMAEDASSKKFLVGNFINYKMVDSRPVMEQYSELLRILGQFAQYNMKMDESISVSSIIDKLHSSWKNFKHDLKHKNEELTLVKLGSTFQIEQSIRDMEKFWVNDDKTMVVPSAVSMVEESESSKCGKVGHFKKDCRVGKIGGKGKNEAGLSGSKDPVKQQGHILVPNSNSVENYVSLISEAFYVQDDEISWWVDSGATSHLCKNLQWFKDFKVIEDGSILKMGNLATETNQGIKKC
ncbi:hypothetical protein L1987_33962 [Smallanthus sonchifolius]|uniref:Uncharacterized protein n=1 Tax=Smallanthus sonchifolius TaxID=185202 RepID=A0ACB9HRZ2_9ASTR|nr:hypothetical protein L1987_33962 [Smallanthus sonchifolius]